MKPASPFILALASACLAGLAAAASLTGSITALPTGTGDSFFNLTVLGAEDWVFWNTTVTSAVPGTPTESKLGAAIIGDMAPAGGGNLRGSSSTTKPTSDFS